MGVLRSLYREVREIIGLPPAAENGTQRAERVCGEIKNELGGKRVKSGDDFALNVEVAGRQVTLLFEAEPSRARIAIAGAIDPDVSFLVERDPLSGVTPAPAGTQRSYVATNLFIAGASQRELAALDASWKGLPTGARGLVAQLLQKTGGAVEVEAGVATFTPEEATLDNKSAKYSVKSQLQSMQKIVEGMESGWPA